MSHDQRPCRCGHSYAAHEHYRAGSDCAFCGAATCARFHAGSRRSDTMPDLNTAVATPNEDHTPATTVG